MPRAIGCWVDTVLDLFLYENANRPFVAEKKRRER
jgi:hypothetical protein